MNITEAALRDRIPQFTKEWRILHEPDSALVDRLLVFLSRSDGLLNVPRRTAALSEPIDVTRLSRIVEALVPALADRRARGTYPNPWTAAGLKRDELRNTSALAFLWNANLSGRPATEFLAAFLHRISPVSDPLPIRELLDGGYQVRVEDSPLGLGSERIDLTIESGSVIFGIEVKIGAPVRDQQLERYCDTIRHRAESMKLQHRVILLAPFPTVVPGVVSASWDDVVAASREVLPPVAGRSFVHHLIDRFAEHVSSWKN